MLLIHMQQENYIPKEQNRERCPHSEKMVTALLLTKTTKLRKA
uniref:Uncharacterized protein n=1 Tax=Rhizophora mucronata TaxID=61149 RepID=A0A2P2P0F5_RHIMU